MTAVDLVCIRCARAVHDPQLGTPCPRCAEEGVASNLTTISDPDRVRTAVQALPHDVHGLARFESLLTAPVDPTATVDVGSTPLVPAPRLAEQLGLRRLWIKDESHGPTWSFKDRAAAVAVSHARSLGSSTIVAASTGNAAAATAAHARRSGLNAVLILSEGVDPTMAAFVGSYGAIMVTAPNKETRWELMAGAVESWGWYPNSNYSDPPIGNNPFAVDGYKTIAYEIWEQLGRRVPDTIHFPVCYGDALFGTWKGFEELRAAELTDRTPVHSAGEIHGTLRDAIDGGSDVIQRATTHRNTAAVSISSRQSTYQALHAVRLSGGEVSAVTDDELFAARRLAVRSSGMLLETSAAAGLAALVRQRDAGVIPADHECVVIGSSSGLKSLRDSDQFDVPRFVASTLDEMAAAVEAQLRTDESAA